jgi:hypothetical protein
MGLETGSYISDFVVTNPAGADDRSTADDHLRLIKSILQTSFPTINGAVTASLAEINKLDGLTASQAELNQLAGRSLTSSDDRIDNFPASTVMLFQQTTAPTGWTKSTTHNDKSLRVVSGTAASGGTEAFTTVFQAGLATAPHTLDISEIPPHSHTYSRSVTEQGVNSGAQVDVREDLGGFNTSTVGGGGGHSHTLTMDIQYVDVILAVKN